MAQPVIGFLAFTSGSFEGAIIRDMRLANALHRRGFRVIVYWMMECNSELVDRGIPQRMICRGTRFQFRRPSGLMDLWGKVCAILPAARRREFMQRHPGWIDKIAMNFVNVVCDGPEGDPAVCRRLAGLLQRDGVTHLLPTFAMICPFVLGAKEHYPFEYLVTFQGEEIFANYAQRIGRMEDYCRRLREVMAGSPWPAVAVSRDYIARLTEEMGLDGTRMTAIYPGIELPRPGPKPPFDTLKPKFPHLKPDEPIVTYIGRQDTEKGIDLLLYAARMLSERGVKMQLVICGGTSFGERYRDVLKGISEHLRIRVHHRRRIPGPMRDALYAHSRCIVYPSIHREPFGMVAAEAMSHGTPVIVPNYGGITEAIKWDGAEGGLTFNVWDSADLARQMERLLKDDALHGQLAANTRGIAEQFSVEKMTDGVLNVMGQSLPAPEIHRPGG